MGDDEAKEEVILSNAVENDPQQHLHDQLEAAQTKGKRGLGFTGDGPGRKPGQAMGSRPAMSCKSAGDLSE